MMNPSDADDEHDDPTVRKGIGFATRWGFNNLIIGNLIPIISTDPWKLPYWHGLFMDNTVHLLAISLSSNMLCVAWGAVPKPIARKVGWSEHVYNFTQNIARNRSLLAIGKTRNGSPLHPSRTAYTDAPNIWRA